MQKIVIGFRGTQAWSMRNWYQSNFKAGLEYPYKDIPETGVHKGFWTSFQGMKTELILALREKLRSHPEASILLTGHSLGAALATVAGFELARSGFPVDEILNFGSPRVGNMHFVKELYALVPKFWRVTRHRDPVVHLPPRNVVLGMYHAGNEVFYDDNSTLSHVVMHGAPENPNGAMQFETGFLDVTDHYMYLGIDTTSSQSCRYGQEDQHASDIIPQQYIRHAYGYSRVETSYGSWSKTKQHESQHSDDS